ncbi:hypothetical protein [Nocardia callitridis]|uniref:Uncharacterized protein n=1 Tax=Nocardia callitridis TaxID=648753 RepID=A0ABP9K251_9NOCA
MTEEDPRFDDSADVAALRRWEQSGALWRVLAHTGDSVVVGLYDCAGGTEMERIASRDPLLLRFLGERTSSED